MTKHAFPTFRQVAIDHAKTNGLEFKEAEYQYGIIRRPAFGANDFLHNVLPSLGGCELARDEHFILYFNPQGTFNNTKETPWD